MLPSGNDGALDETLLPVDGFETQPETAYEAIKAMNIFLEFMFIKFPENFD